MQILRHARPALFAAVGALALAATAAPVLAQAPAAINQTVSGGIIISQEGFAALAARPDVKLVDVRSATAYAEGHIPGALSLPWQALGLSEVGGVRNEFAPDEELARLFGEAGLSYDDTIVIYDSGTLAGRAYVTFEYAGFPNIHVLDGGISAWTGERTTEVPVVTATNFALDRKQELRVDRTYVAAQLGAEGTAILDGRGLDAYQDGHIPTATSLPSGTFIDQNALLKPREELLASLAAQGITPDQKIVSYCGSGVAAANTYLALRELGFTDIVLYDGSWDDWSRNPESGQEVALPNYTFDVASVPGGAGPSFLTDEEVKELQADPNVVVLDVRSPSDYGAGRIPGSVNVYWNSTLDDARVLKSVDELRALYAAQGVTPDKHVIIFTRGGLQLTHTFTVLNLLGFENVDLFTGAFEGWDNASYRNL
jgi:3-mercaptopyruvate sulfurtransferase SseA